MIDPGADSPPFLLPHRALVSAGCLLMAAFLWSLTVGIVGAWLQEFSMPLLARRPVWELWVDRSLSLFFLAMLGHAGFVCLCAAWSAWFPLPRCVTPRWAPQPLWRNPESL